MEITQPSEDYARYLVDKFHAPTATAKPALFESTDLSLYLPSARCAAFFPSEDRLLHWIYVLANRYCNHLNNHETGYKATWKEQLVHSTPSKCEKIRTIHLLCTTKNSAEEQLATVTVFVSTGQILIRGKQYKEWSEIEFPVLVHIVNSIESIPPCPSNNSLVTTELSNFFQHYVRFVSEDEILVSNHSISGIAATSTATDSSNLTLSDSLITTSVAESLSITLSRLSKVRFSTLSFTLD